MDNALSQLISIQFVFFCLAITAVVFVIRRVVEFYVKSVSAKDFWEGLILPIAPMVLGAAGAYFIKSYPYPEGLTSASSRFVFGLVAGLLSGLVYRLIKGFLKSKAKAYLTSDKSDDGSVTPNNITSNARPGNVMPDDEDSR